MLLLLIMNSSGFGCRILIDLMSNFDFRMGAPKNVDVDDGNLEIGMGKFCPQ